MSSPRARTASNPALNTSCSPSSWRSPCSSCSGSATATRPTSDYYAAGGAFTGAQNGIALSGDFLSAASFLGIAGAIAVNGYDGFLYSIGFLVAWLVDLLLIAELLRNTGRFTMGDVLSFRMNQRPVRAAAATSTLVISFFYMLAQMAGAGGLVALLLGVHGQARAGARDQRRRPVMILYVLVGGMKGTTWVQIIKAAMLIVWRGADDGVPARQVRLQLLRTCSTARRRTTRKGERRCSSPGAQYGKTAPTKLDFVSLALALVLGTAGLPHVLMRFYTVPNAARRAARWSGRSVLIGVFYLFTLVHRLRRGARWSAPDEITTAPGKENSAAPLLALQIGGTLLLGIISAVAFATILAVVAGLTITASASFAHDVYANIIKQGKADAGGGGPGGAAHRDRDRRAGDRRRHPGERPERRVPGGAGVRVGRVGEPADDAVLAVLEAVQHDRARCGACTAASARACCW